MNKDPYGILLSSFFDGATGQELQSRGGPGKDAMILAAFLCANRFANMIGLYEISISKVANTLTAIRSTSLRRAFLLLAELRYAYYDERTEYVWVREMARVRLALDGTPLKSDDKRLLGAKRLYERLPLNPFLGPFFDRYSVELRLSKRRSGGPLDIEGASQGVSKGASQGDTEGVSDNPLRQQEYQVHQVPVQREDQTTGISTPSTSTTERTPASPENARENGKTDKAPSEHLDVIVAVVTKELLPLGIADSDLPEATKEHCARLGIAYDSRTVRQAIDIAQARAHLERPMFTRPTP